MAPAARREGDVVVGRSRISSLLERGHRVIPVVAIPRVLVARLERLRVPRPVAVAMVVAGQWPTLLNELLTVVAPSQGVTTGASRVWLLICGALCSLMLLSARSGWRRVSAAGDLVHEMVDESPDRAVTIERWLWRALSPARQLGVCLLAAVLCVALLIGVRPALLPDISVGLASYLMVGWLGFLGGNVMYWLCVMGDLPRRIRRCRPVTLMRHDPAMTPGLIALCDGYIFVASAMSLGILVTEITALVLPNRTDSALLRDMVLFFPVFAGLIALWAAIQPFLPIYLLAREVKREMLLDLSAEVAASGPQTHNRMLELYFHIRSASLLPINTATVVQYGAAIVGVVGGFAIPKLIA